MSGKIYIKSIYEKSILQGFIKEFSVYWENHQMRRRTVIHLFNTRARITLLQTLKQKRIC